MTTPLLKVDSLSVQFPIYAGVVHAVEDVSLSVDRGEIVGIVGETGSGKSIFLRALMNMVRSPGRIVAGDVLFNGRSLLQLSDEELRAVRGHQIALIGSNPKTLLDPLVRVGDQIAKVLVSHGLADDKAARGRAMEWIKAVGIPDPERRMHAYPHELSGGMAQRVVIAMALAPQPTLVLADEPTTGLDVTVQLQVLEILRDLTLNSGAAAILVTRDLGIVANYCHRVAVMQAGQIAEQAPVRTMFEAARHPYSLALLRAAFAARGEASVEGLTGTTGRRFEPLAACPLVASCPLVEPQCRQENPELTAVGDGHLVRCFVKARS
jgi:oligopeptide/dipeptide ABC transporter ATP-binding protein